jgi:hypothetical protein
MVHHGVFLGILVGALVVGTLGIAHAVAILELSSGTTTQTITDNALGLDLDPADGSIIFSGPIGNFLLNLTIGLSKPQVGGDEDAILDLLSFNASTVFGGTLVIRFTDVDFILPQNANGATSAIGGTMTGAGSVTFKTFLDDTNTAFGTGTPLANLGPYTGTPVFPTPFSGSSSIGVTTSDPFSLTEVVTLTHTGAAMTSFDATLRVGSPEPTSLLLLGSGLAGLGLLGRKKFKVRS